MIEPQPFITRNDYFKLDVNERPTEGVCPKHGGYKIKVDESLPLKIVMSTCPECTKEYNKWSSKAKEEQEIKDKASRKEKDRQICLNNYGVSPRHRGKTFETYTADTKEKKFALETCKYVAQKVVDKVAKNVIMCGSVGTGKTHLAVSMCHFLADSSVNDGVYQKVSLETVTEIIREYRSTYQRDSEKTEQDVINYYSTRDLLIIDELGTSKGDDKELNILFEIINNRYETKRPTVVISNQSIEKVKEILGARIIDRLKEDGCRVLGMQWDSYRETNKAEF